MRRSWTRQLPVLVAIAAIHALLCLGLWAHRVVVQKTDTPPLFVDLLQPETPAPIPPPPPPPSWRPPSVPVIPSDFALTLPDTSSNAITVAAAPVQEPQPARTEAITEARFDADYLNNPEPMYPAAARRMREHGLVLLKVKVLPDGCSGAVLVHESSGSRNLDQAAMQAVKRWKFVPAKRGQQPIESWVLVPIEFELSG